MSAHADQDPAPGLAIVRGDPSAEQIAAVVAVLSALLESAGAPGAGETARYGWSDRSRLLAEPLARGPGGWRASALPR
ncbi:MAG TPA: acyl-CoA carboxylase subunit epsilon [Streptosporangiaceae bacterium]|nr:acyl-CoA carboxylase subunit epsilon [Streptosporangiaceae bacterium]